MKRFFCTVALMTFTLIFMCKAEYTITVPNDVKGRKIFVNYDSDLLHNVKCTLHEDTLSCQASGAAHGNLLNLPYNIQSASVNIGNIEEFYLRATDLWQDYNGCGGKLEIKSLIGVIDAFFQNSIDAERYYTRYPLESKNLSNLLLADENAQKNSPVK